MDRKQLESTFDGQASTYDQQWNKLAPFRDGIHLLLGSLFIGLPQNARMLCVGAWTGAEIHYLADRFRGAVWEEVIILLLYKVFRGSTSMMYDASIKAGFTKVTRMLGEKISSRKCSTENSVFSSNIALSILQ